MDTYSNHAQPPDQHSGHQTRTSAWPTLWPSNARTWRIQASHIRIYAPSILIIHFARFTIMFLHPLRRLRPPWPVPNITANSIRMGCSRIILDSNTRLRVLPEDVSMPLRDAFEGWLNCRHCKYYFASTYALRDHISKHICHAFDARQAIVQPIVAREELRMHIRHRSFMGFMLDGTLYSEFATRCAFCNMVFHIRAMKHHYTNSHPCVDAKALMSNNTFVRSFFN